MKLYVKEKHLHNTNLRYNYFLKARGGEKNYRICQGSFLSFAKFMFGWVEIHTMNWHNLLFRQSIPSVGSFWGFVIYTSLTWTFLELGRCHFKNVYSSITRPFFLFKVNEFFCISVDFRLPRQKRFLSFVFFMRWESVSVVKLPSSSYIGNLKSAHNMACTAVQPKKKLYKYNFL